MRNLWKVLKKRSAAVGLGLVVAAGVAWALYPQNDVQSGFRDEVMAIAQAEWKEGRGHVNITEIIEKRLRDNPELDEVDLFYKLGLNEVDVVRPQQDLLKEYNADTYRGFTRIVRRTGIASYWEVRLVAFYRDGVLVDVLGYVSYVSL